MLAPAEMAVVPSRNAAELAPKTRQQLFEELARESWQNGQAALAADDIVQARRFLERAHRIAPDDAAISLALASAYLRAGGLSDAARLLDAVVHSHDLREAWLTLAAARHGLRDAPGAAAALAQALSAHVLVEDTHIARLAAAIVDGCGAAGWCGLRTDGRLVVHCATAGRPVVFCDGRRLRAGDIAALRVSDTARRVDISIAGRALLGSSLRVANIRRTEGVVEARGGGLEGWAWHPGDPDANPVLTIRGATGRVGLTIVADDTDIVGSSPMSRPRRFHVPAERLAGLRGMLRVVARDGRDLLGSPIDPGAERFSAVAAARAVGHLFPLASGARDGTVGLGAMPAASARAKGVAAVARSAPKRAVAVVVPVYKGLRVTLDCLDAVFATMPAGSRVIVVDDASPEPELAASLDALRGEGRITLLRHDRNLGFPCSANAGMRAAARLPGRPDIVLLNSDTLVTAGWLEGLRAAVHAAPDIGTATPFSNDATILSYPDIARPNPAPDTKRLARLARLAAAANPAGAVEIPTAVGFCMYVRRECLHDVGLFREDVFAQGYGEENDFCIRARHLGWRHVGVPGVYVAHLGGQSFGGGTSPLIRRNLAVMERLHPGYADLIADFQRTDALAGARRRLDMVRWREGRSKVGAAILVTHDSGGGVERVVQARCRALRAAGLRPILLRPVLAEAGERTYRPGLCDVGEANGGFPNLRFAVPEELTALVRLLRGDRPVVMEVHHLLGHSHDVMRLPKLLGIPSEIHVHDYAMFCPRISLLGREGRYCGEPEAASCDACVADLGRNTEEDISVADLRARSAADLAAARRVVVPSTDLAARWRRHFPAVTPVVEPLEDDAGLPPMAPLARTGPRHVCVVGAIGTEKGYDVLLSCARDAAARSLPLNFTLVGHTPDDGRLMATGRVFVTGPYRDEQVVDLIRDQGAQLAWLPSIWPETWCFAMTHAWRAGLGVAAFDIGAPADRIRRTGRGWVLPLGLSPQGINNALLAVATVARDE
jgi:GT2 family glycosyltransferase/glycosyltransferase involved in cell wall biosynthesis